jgi:2-isopropylmalate synthase
MLRDPSSKYRAFEPIEMVAREWPSKKIVKPPIWLSTDLRDGNQALFEPMNGEKKYRYFKELLKIGFKEIELGFPAASELDFNFVRRLIDENLIPEDVTPMVMTQAREDLISKSVVSLLGSKKAIIHIYNAIAPAWREIVFGLSVSEVMRLIEHHVGFLEKITRKHPETEWILQYSPETFCMAELEVSLQACHTAMRAWNADLSRKIIINLPTTVENATPNVFADQIEWMHKNLDNRNSIILSVHPHNDRGTGVAAAELAQMAGADRVEGCLFGNGERSGNVDIVTLALNLYTQGIHPGLDFSNINAIAMVAEECTKLPIHPRHPYVGDLVFTAFSGSHQDAIKKGFAKQIGEDFWNVPYLPIDPADLGRTYDGVIRVNSQSGKGGISYILENNYGIVMPRRMQIEFSSIVQAIADSSEAEMSAGSIWELFSKTYLDRQNCSGKGLSYVHHSLLESNGRQVIELDVLNVDGQAVKLGGVGSGPIDAAVNAIGLDIQVLGYEERSVGCGADAQALAIIEVQSNAALGSKFGAGRHANIVTASLMALFNAIERLN